MNRTLGISILLVFHIIGLVLFALDSESAQLSYVSLLVSFIVLFFGTKKFKNTIAPILLIFAGGYIIEFIGIHSGLLFGDYSYGNALGIKLSGVPLIIGVNWICIILGSHTLARNIHQNKWVVSVLTATIATTMDYLIEPIAIKYDFWSWQSEVIPIYNYICWFIASFFFGLITNIFIQEENKFGIPLLIIWTGFFVILRYYP